MNVFSLTLQSAGRREQLDNVVSFVGEDDSGSFGLQAGHAHFITALTFGLARLRYADGKIDYLALPGAVLRFKENQLEISCRRYLRNSDHTAISSALREELISEEQRLQSFKSSLAEMEQAVLQRLWRLNTKETAP